MATAEQHATAVLAAINAKLTALTVPLTAYELDDVPEPLPTAYAELTLSRRFGTATRLPGRQSRTGWRITTRAVAKGVTNARLVHEKTRQALEDARLDIGGVLTSPIQFETEEPVGDDDGWFSGLISWTYTHGGKPHA